jgi:hypothetical protein
MRAIGVISVQLGNCTDGLSTKNNRVPSKTSHAPLQTHHHHWPTHLERLTDRTLHPLRQTWMQVRRYSRPWSKILSVGQLSWPQTRTGVCASKIPRSSRSFSPQLSDGQADLRRDLEYQSRTAASERHAVKNAHGYPAGLFYVDRDHGFCNLRSKYASGVVGRNIGRNRHMGGKR